MDLPVAPKFKNLIGPSFILLGLGLGSGELILWPYLTANWGLGIIWGAILGVTFQFFINMEIERYTLVKRDSIFIGFAKRFRFLPIWFVFSTFICWSWPGIIATSARLLGEVIGFTNYNLLGICLLLLIGIILTIGKDLYKTVEKFSTVLIAIAVPTIFILTFYLTDKTDLIDLFKGAINLGFIPESLPMASFLAAFAFAGAGGNLNLAQSFYIKEKGYGEFKKWWKIANLEHLLIFWFGGILTICILSLLAYTTVYRLGNLPEGVGFIISEASYVSQKIFPLAGLGFLIAAGLMLFNTQLTVLDATTRIMTENLIILKKKGDFLKVYYIFLWSQIIFGIIIFTLKLDQPLYLLTISAVLNAIAMFVHIGLTTFLNVVELDNKTRPSIFRLAIILIAFLFFGYFSFKVVTGIF